VRTARGTTLSRSNEEDAERQAEVTTLYDSFNRNLARALALAGGCIIPVGLIISSIFGGLHGFAGALIGFGAASLYSIAALASLKWALKKPVEKMPVVLLSMFVARLVIVVLALYGLTFATAINRVAIFACFAALFLAYSILEITYAWKTFGVLFKPPE
jgi:hypothetical protein